MKLAISSIILACLFFACKEPANTTSSINTVDSVIPSEQPTQNTLLSTYRWKLRELTGKTIDSINAQEPFIIFNPADSSVNGRMGCNRFGGKYATSDNSIRFSLFYSTKMACADMWAETTFLSLVDSINEYRIVEKELSLIRNGNAVAVFEGMPAL